MVDKNIKGVIWDWNGTLLNDTAYSVACINKLLLRRGLPCLSVNDYRNLFTFPVIDFYKLAGFDFANEQWNSLAMEFMEEYWSGFDNLRLNLGAIETLKYLRACGVPSYLLSAMEDTKLKYMLEQRGLLQYFEEVRGISDHFAASKQAIGTDLIHNIDISKENLIMIGDTNHDVEIAHYLGVRPYFFIHGHQHPERFSELEFSTIGEISEIIELISNVKF